MPVVAARVHDAGSLGRELEAGLLLDRQRVDVRPERERRTGPAGAEVRDDARLRRPLELDALRAADQLEEERRRLVLLERQFGMCVQIPPPGDRLLFQLGGDERAHGGTAYRPNGRANSQATLSLDVLH